MTNVFLKVRIYPLFGPLPLDRHLGCCYIYLKYNIKKMATVSIPGKEASVSESITIHRDSRTSTHGVSGFFPAIVNMIAEDGGSFFSYLKELGLERENNLVVLSSRHHYFYDEEELKKVSTLINLKKLNQVKYLDEFLFTLSRVLPENTRFLGCFIDSSPLGESLLHPIKLLKHTAIRLDLLGERKLTRKKVTEILESNGFKVTDMTEKDGVTYFCTRSDSKSVRLRA